MESNVKIIKYNVMMLSSVWRIHTTNTEENYKVLEGIFITNLVTGKRVEITIEDLEKLKLEIENEYDEFNITVEDKDFIINELQNFIEDVKEYV